MKRLKLLLIAPFVCRQSTGEGASAYHWVSRLAKRCDVTLLTYNLRADPPASEQGLSARIVEWPDLPLVGRWPRLNSQLTPGYVPFFFRTRRWLKVNLRREKFDLVHQLAPLGLRYPCPAVGLGAPFVVGPLGGSLPTPPALRNAAKGEPLMRRLRIADRLRFSFDPLLRRTYSEARALIVVAPYVRDLLSCLSLPRLHFMSEAGVVRPHGQRSDRTQAGSPRRLLFVGRVVRTKGARDAIHALAHLRDAQATLDIVGTGEDLPACQRAVHELRLEDRVRFHGHIARSDVTALYRQADVFVFPSFREPSGKAVIEAMSHGLPVIATNYGGPGFVVDDQCGRLVEPAPPDEFAMAIAARIDSLLEDPALQTTLGAGALRRIEERYTWDKKVDWLCELYQELI